MNQNAWNDMQATDAKASVAPGLGVLRLYDFQVELPFALENGPALFNMFKGKSPALNQ